jgi:hypothetical protein
MATSKSIEPTKTHGVTIQRFITKLPSLPLNGTPRRATANAQQLTAFYLAIKFRSNAKNQLV